MSQTFVNREEYEKYLYSQSTPNFSSPPNRPITYTMSSQPSLNSPTYPMISTERFQFTPPNFSSPPNRPIPYSMSSQPSMNSPTYPMISPERLQHNYGLSSPTFDPPNFQLKSRRKPKTEGDNAKARWSDKQTNTLVSEWKEMFTSINSSNSRNVWAEVCSAVNEADQNAEPKTVSQCKMKINNLKKTYTNCADLNKKTGESPHNCKYFDDFEEVLSDRASMALPEFKQSNILPKDIIDSEEETSEPEEVENTRSPLTPLSPTHPRQKLKSKRTAVNDAASENYLQSLHAAKEAKVKKRERQDKEKKSDLPKKNVGTKAADLVGQQIQCIENTAKLQREFIKDMMDENRKMEERDRERQREADERERQKDREFFLELAKVMK